MLTSSNGNIVRVTGHLCREFTGHRWIPRTKASDTELNVLFDLRLNKRLNKRSWGCWLQTPSRPLWRHCNVYDILDIGRLKNQCAQWSVKLITAIIPTIMIHLPYLCNIEYTTQWIPWMSDFRHWIMTQYSGTIMIQITINKYKLITK